MTNYKTDRLSTKIEKNLKSGNELYFVSASWNSLQEHAWVRCPMKTREDAMDLISDFMSDPSYERVQVISENRLSERVSIYDENVGKWKDSTYTLREQMFGSRYQDLWENFCKTYGVNLDEIEKLQSDRAEYLELMNAKFPKKSAA